MFDHRRFGLEQAVIGLKKIMTRRLAKLPKGLEASDIWNPVMGIDDKGRVYFTVNCIDSKLRDLYPKYQVGEVVAVAQSYSDLGFTGFKYENTYGWSNKMYVCAELMPHRIKITNIKLERLQDISDEDCVKEGIVQLIAKVADIEIVSYIYKGIRLIELQAFKVPRAAFRSLITKMMGKKTWDRNPWVWAYEFELIK